MLGGVRVSRWGGGGAMGVNSGLVAVLLATGKETVKL